MTRFVRLLCLLIVNMVGLWAQAVNGSLVGSVTDTSNAAVPSAKVTLLAVDTGITQTTTSNQSGNYSFVNLQPGVYKVEVELQGFRKAD